MPAYQSTVQSAYQMGPIFIDNMNAIVSECCKIATMKNVEVFLIDAMPIDDWVKQGCKPAVTNSIILSDVPNQKNIKKIPDTFYGVYYNAYPVPIINEPKKQFNCFMNRMDPIRQSWLYQFVRRQFFDQGYVSFNMDCRQIPWYVEWDPHDAFQDQFERHLKIFQKEHEIIKSKVPYRNFDLDTDITDIILDSKISVVLETYFHNNDIITYSEKIFRALQLPRPWLLYAQKNAVKYLRHMGFDVLDDVINHSMYDNIDFAIERQVRILDILEANMDKNLDYDRLQKAATSNQNLLKNFSKKWFDDFISCVETASLFRN